MALSPGHHRLHADSNGRVWKLLSMVLMIRRVVFSLVIMPAARTLNESTIWFVKRAEFRVIHSHKM